MSIHFAHVKSVQLKSKPFLKHELKFCDKNCLIGFLKQKKRLCLHYTAKINNDDNVSLTVADVNCFSVTQECWVEDITSRTLTIQTTDGIVTMTAAARLVRLLECWLLYTLYNKHL